ncbi:MAG: RDD family protein [Ignavibacteriae bacterium]|nr:MAG: RDD family protein [Ignavibacteriota bacterium]
MELNQNKKYTIELASIFNRFIAINIDFIIIAIAYFLLYYIIDILIPVSESLLIALLRFIGVIVIPWFYFAFQETTGNYATIGQKIMGIKVTDEYYRNISFGRSTARFFLKMYLSAMLLSSIGFVIAFFTKKKQALHDLIVKTIVIKDTGETTEKPVEKVIKVCGDCKTVYHPNKSDFAKGTFICPICGKENIIWNKK